MTKKEKQINYKYRRGKNDREGYFNWQVSFPRVPFDVLKQPLHSFSFVFLQIYFVQTDISPLHVLCLFYFLSPTYVLRLSMIRLIIPSVVIVELGVSISL